MHSFWGTRGAAAISVSWTLLKFPCIIIITIICMCACTQKLLQLRMKAELCITLKGMGAARSQCDLPTKWPPFSVFIHFFGPGWLHPVGLTFRKGCCSQVATRQRILLYHKGAVSVLSVTPALKCPFFQVGKLNK